MITEYSVKENNIYFYIPRLKNTKRILLVFDEYERKMAISNFQKET